MSQSLLNFDNCFGHILMKNTEFIHIMLNAESENFNAQVTSR